MKFSDYCDMIENTEKEQELFDFMNTDQSMQEAWDVLEKMQDVPVLGKIITALGELAECNSIAAFKETEHYAVLANWNLHFDAEKGEFSLSPGPKHLAVAKCVLAAIVACIVLCVVCRKCCKRR